MNRVVVDASVLGAVVFAEAEGADWSGRMEGAAVFAPRLLQFELQSIARKKCRLRPREASAVVEALSRALDARRGITWIDLNPADVVLIANATGLSAYDASYLCLAGMLGADLLTADRRLAAAVDSRPQKSG